MAVPKRRTSHSRKKLRQSHDALSVPALSLDRKTKSIHRPHHIDLRTGFYRGRQVLFTEDGGDAAEGGKDQDAKG